MHGAPLSLLLLAAALLAAAPARGQGATEIVGCYDAERDLISHGLAASCRGEIVDAAREAELAAERKRRIQAVVSGGKADPVAGNRRLIGTGSGFYITAAGEALTNNHVIDHCDMVTVTTEGRPKLAATVAAADAQRDIALLRTGAEAPAFARFATTPEDIVKGDLAVVGYPAYGLPTIRSSIVVATATGPPAVERDDVVFAGVIRRGHSGSPLLDGMGHVLGVVRAKPDSVRIYQATKQLPPDLGIAVSRTATLRFLAAQGVKPTMEPGGAGLPRDALHEKAHAFVLQVGCWR